MVGVGCHSGECDVSVHCLYRLTSKSQSELKVEEQGEYRSSRIPPGPIFGVTRREIGWRTILDSRTDKTEIVRESGRCSCYCQSDAAMFCARANSFLACPRVVVQDLRSALASEPNSFPILSNADCQNCSYVSRSRHGQSKQADTCHSPARFPPLHPSRSWHLRRTRRRGHTTCRPQIGP